MHTAVTPQKINKITESRFGFTVDYDNLTYAKAQRLATALGENITQIKKSFGAHTAEKNPRYVELMLVKEGLDKWLKSEQGLFESEMGKSEAVLAAKDIVDSIQDMLEKVSKIQNEQVPALVDTIRDQIGTEQADAFKTSITPVLDTLYQAMQSGRETADTSVRALSGEQIGGGMDLTGPELGVEPGADAGLDAAPLDSDLDTDVDGDGFDTTDAAVGGSIDDTEEPELGRERR